MRSRWFAGLSLAAMAVLATGSIVAGGEEADFKSGLQPGETTSAFQCRDVTGPNKGKSLCYV